MSEYDLRTALLVVDVQNDFADPSGSLFVPGAEVVVVAANRQVQAARAAGAKVVYTQDWHPAHTGHFATEGGVWPVHCVGGSWGAAFHPDLIVRGEVVRKGSNGEDGYSGFTMRDPGSGDEVPTRLAAVLHGAGVREVVIVGLATDYCVVSTAIDALALGFATTVLRAAVAAVDLEPGHGKAALERLAYAGAQVV